MHSLLADLPLDVWRHDLSKAVQVLSDVNLVQTQIVEERMDILFRLAIRLARLDSVEEALARSACERVVRLAVDWLSEA